MADPDPREILANIQAQTERADAERRAQLEEMMGELRSSVLTGQADAAELRLLESMAVEKALLEALMRNGQETLRLMRARLDSEPPK